MGCRGHFGPQAEISGWNTGHMTVLPGQVYNSSQWQLYFLKLSSCRFWLQAQVPNEKAL